MSVSAESKGFHKFCRKYLPFMLRRCPGWNLHWRWSRFCVCCAATNGIGPLIRIEGNVWLDGELRPIPVPYWKTFQESMLPGKVIS